MLFALAFFLSEDKDVLKGGSGRSLLQLYSTGTETISMGPDGMMSSSGSFEMGYMNSFKTHVSHAAHHVQQRIASVAHKIANLAKHLSVHDKEVTKEKIDAYVNKQSTLKKKGWTKEIAHKKAEYFYKHHDVFQQMLDGEFDPYDKNKIQKTEDAKVAAKAAKKSIVNKNPLPLIKIGASTDDLKKVPVAPHIDCPVARCAECLPGQQTKWLPEVRDQHGCPRLCNFKCVGE